MEKLQKRIINKATVQARELNSDSKEMIIEGILPYNSPSEKMYIGYGDYDVEREVITNTAWKKTLNDNRNIFLNYNHNSDLILGSTKSGTLTVENKEDGLHFRCYLPDTDIGHRAYTTIKRKDVTTLSFEFVPVEWRTDKDLKTVYVTSGRLDAISVCVSTPAYTSTDCQARNFQEKIQTIKETIKDKDIMNMDKEEIKELKELLLSILDKIPEEENKEENKEEKSADNEAERTEEEKKEETSGQPDDIQTEETDDSEDVPTEEEKEIEKLAEELATLKKVLEELKNENKED